MNQALLVLMAALAIFYFTDHEAATATVLSSAGREFLYLHNQARAAVGVLPLSWSEKLASATSRLIGFQRDHKGCKLAKLPIGTKKYGWNQFWTGWKTVTPRMVVDSWVEEKNYYNHTDNICVPNLMCGLYTQVVWNTSLELGCTQAICINDRATLTICFYNPPGNFAGVKPY
ncbi:Pathogenesis-related protein 1 [Quillaja saponaria]|uniref:Pathogenesis-related protein 1 n=1 Tax=Quillaja saponaria TaxID=32244 RepID=A0AAD7PET2_QUISA|nr:Pathogenesis-related protein 1 [Quillaja saponaria]